MCKGRVGDFQAIGYPGSFSLNFSLRSALLLEEKERCEEVTEEMEHAKKQVHSCAMRMERSSEMSSWKQKLQLLSFSLFMKIFKLRHST